jgi:hypothetical protein
MKLQTLIQNLENKVNQLIAQAKSGVEGLRNLIIEMMLRISKLEKKLNLLNNKKEENPMDDNLILLPLEGSPKQIAWAEKIRMSFLGNYLPKALQNTRYADPSFQLWSKKQIFNYLNLLFTSAKKWIEWKDRFDVLSREVLKDLEHNYLFQNTEDMEKEKRINDLVDSW